MPAGGINREVLSMDDILFRLSHEIISLIDSKEMIITIWIDGCHPQRGDPVEAARQSTYGHPHITGTAATGRITSTTAHLSDVPVWYYQTIILSALIQAIFLFNFKLPNIK